MTATTNRPRRRAAKPPTEQELLQRWHERVRTGRFSPAVRSVREMRVFGKSGDESVAFPQISSLAALETLEPDERFALSYAERIIEARRSQGRPIFRVPAGGIGGTELRKFDPTLAEDILILNPIVGG